MSFNATKLKRDFPIFKRTVNDQPLVYLDNASTTQKPASVIQALTDYYTTMNANIHRGIHTLSEEATAAYEKTRAMVADFIGASSGVGTSASEEIIFTRNATEAINLVAYTWGETQIREGDTIIVSALEHHSNLVPWQELCRRKGAALEVIPLHEDGTLDMESFETMLVKGVKLVAITQMSNVLGTITPLSKIIAAAHAVGAKVLVDGAQGVAHLGIDVQKLDCDFLAFSGHKMLGPTGVGILYAKKELLENMPPFLFGGDMVLEVEQQRANWNALPWKFEAGTPNIADVIAFQKALEYLQKIGMQNIADHDRQLLTYARKKVGALPKIQLYGPDDLAQTGGILAFNIPGVHPHDVGSIVNEDGIAIRAGHHCAQPLLARLGVNATARMSFYFYNTESDIDRAVAALQKVYRIFKLA